MKEKYSEWEFPQPKWFWDYDRVVAYLEQVEEQKNWLFKQEEELNAREKELKVILYDNPENVPARTELDNMAKLKRNLESMIWEGRITEKTLRFVLGHGEHQQAFMKWRYNWDENGMCLGLRDLEEEVRDESSER